VSGKIIVLVIFSIVVIVPILSFIFLSKEDKNYKCYSETRQELIDIWFK